MPEDNARLQELNLLSFQREHQETVITDSEISEKKFGTKYVLTTKDKIIPRQVLTF